MQRMPIHKIIMLLWLYYIKKKMIRMMKMKETASHRGQTLASSPKVYTVHQLVSVVKSCGCAFHCSASYLVNVGRKKGRQGFTLGEIPTYPYCCTVSQPACVFKILIIYHLCIDLSFAFKLHWCHYRYNNMALLFIAIESIQFSYTPTRCIQQISIHKYFNCFITVLHSGKLWRRETSVNLLRISSKVSSINCLQHMKKAIRAGLEFANCNLACHLPKTSPVKVYHYTVFQRMVTALLECFDASGATMLHTCMCKRQPVYNVMPSIPYVTVVFSFLYSSTYHIVQQYYIQG